MVRIDHYLPKSTGLKVFVQSRSKNGSVVRVLAVLRGHLRGYGRFFFFLDIGSELYCPNA